MIVDIRPHKIAIMEQDVAAFEQEIGLAIPKVYRDFLMQNNGATFSIPNGGSRSEWLVGFEAEPAMPTQDRAVGEPFFWSLALMHGLLREPDDYGDLRAIYRSTLDWRHLPELLPIASEMDNSKLFLCLEAPYAIMVPGQNYAEKYNDEVDIIFEDYVKVVNSFDEFIQLLEWRYQAL